VKERLLLKKKKSTIIKQINYMRGEFEHYDGTPITTIEQKTLDEVKLNLHKAMEDLLRVAKLIEQVEQELNKAE
jgi:hypothetical protein